ncbi:CVNH domain-containing protein [Nostoc sphaeroides CHAB 2801]|uniref:mannose-binding lectin n=1 Tax=Nostoc sphaeroides TaxID=446679 RepID=UPI000E5130CA|nr:CVNH domain-containing protein [Nostoc sphaeroides]MCC5627214.1 CVNH domain-containing protein [Nostoc sphaeroides CHAB 2801]
MSYLTKLSQSPRLMTLAVCSAMLATVPIDAAFAGPSSPSTYQNSCRNIGVTGATLTANCRRRNGTFNRTSILIRGIDNINGNLRYGSSPTAASSYAASCQNIRVSGATLRANCRTRNGRLNSTSILIRGIDNINGNLRYS